MIRASSLTLAAALLAGIWNSEALAQYSSRDVLMSPEGRSRAAMGAPRARSGPQRTSYAKMRQGQMRQGEFRESEPDDVAAEAAPPRRTRTASSRTVRKTAEAESMPVPEEIMPGPGPREGGQFYEGGDRYFGPDCDGCGPIGACGCCGPRFWIRGEYLQWATKGMEVPALVATAPVGGTGALGGPGTEIVFGDTAINDDTRSGVRLTVGWDPWACNDWSIEMNYIGLDKEESEFALGNVPGRIVTRPFFNIQPDTGDPRQDGELVSSPNVLDGTVDVRANTDFQSVEGLLRRCCSQDCRRRLDFLFGYRFAQLDDSLLIGEALTSLDATSGVAVGTRIDLFDSFDTTNEFHGFDMGFEAAFTRCRWTMTLLAKLGIGVTSSTVTINGQTTRTVPGAGAATSAGGLFTQPSNIGMFDQDNFSVLPELGLSLKYELTPCLHAYAGYNFIYWSRVARAGDQIDFDVNLTQQPPGPIAGALRPDFEFHSIDFWAQGASVGLEWRR
jgi:hypothetical protein